MNNLNAIKSAIENAERSIRQAKQLLAELEGGRPSQPPQSPQLPPKDDRPGIVGLYDGEKMVTSSGEAFLVPGNYASKSLLVIGDTLKMYTEGGESRFKQVEHVKRHKTTGLLVKKDGKFRAITPEGSYKVLTESINHFKGDVGDEVVLYLPAGNLTAPYGAIETIHKKSPNPPTGGEAENVEVALEVVKEEQKPARNATHSAAGGEEPVKEEPKPAVHKPKVAPKPEKKPAHNAPPEAAASLQTGTPSVAGGEVKPAPAVVNLVANEVVTAAKSEAEPKAEVVPVASGEEELS